MKKVIILDVSEEDYNKGRNMLGAAVQVAYIHGMWDNDEAGRIYGDKGWLPEFNELMDYYEFVEQIENELLENIKKNTPEDVDNGEI